MTSTDTGITLRCQKYELHLPDTAKTMKDSKTFMFCFSAWNSQKCQLSNSASSWLEKVRLKTGMFLLLLLFLF